jgi:hypothetical protein
MIDEPQTTEEKRGHALKLASSSRKLLAIGREVIKYDENWERKPYLLEHANSSPKIATV